MMKFPNFEDMKSGKIFEKIKMSIDSLGVSDTSGKQASEPTTPLEACLVLVDELQEIQRIQANLFNKLKTVLAQMAKEEAVHAAEGIENENNPH